MEMILIYVENHDQFKFYLRFKENLNKLGYNFIVVTQKPSLIYLAYLNRLKCHLVKSNKYVTIYPPSDICELYNGILTESECSQYYSSVFNTIEKVIKKYDIRNTFIYNGLSIPSYANKILCEKYNIKSLFFELANLPGKLFVDCIGVNAHSSIYENPKLLSKYEASYKNYKDWKESKFLVTNKNTKTRDNQFLKSIYYFIDLVLIKLLKLPKSGEYSLIRKYRLRSNYRNLNINYDIVDVKKTKYIFLPLQVNNDTQLVINSEIKNIEAIEIVAEKAKNAKLSLVIKPHPKETDFLYYQKILELKKVYNFYIVNLPLHYLITNCEQVYTINSTAGLEAMILDKKVTFLGRTFYSKLNPKLLKNYIVNFLLDIEYNSNKSIELNVIEELMSRFTIAK